MRGPKYFLYEGGVRVLEIIRHPRVIEPGFVPHERVVGTDWFVTLAKLGGGSVPDDRPIDATDVSAAFEGNDLQERTIFWALDSRSELEYVVRTGPWKLFNLKVKELGQVENQSKQFKEIRAAINLDKLSVMRRRNGSSE